MASIFTKIIQREIPAHIVAEDASHIAFLDINPLVKGHTLVIPKVEIDYIYDLDDAALASLMAFSKRVAAAIEKSVSCERIAISVIGIEVPHCHLHLIPLNQMEDVNFSRPKLSLSQEALAETAKTIAGHFK